MSNEKKSSGREVVDSTTGEVKEMTTKSDGAGGILRPDEMPGLAKLFSEGFASERTFWIGDPAKAGKVAIYFGQMIGVGGDIEVEDMASKPDPETGEKGKRLIPSYLFNPIDPVTLTVNTRVLDSIICSHQVAGFCKRYETLARHQLGKAQILFRWKGKVETRKGNQMNDVETMYRLVETKAITVVPDAPKG